MKILVDEMPKTSQECLFSKKITKQMGNRVGTLQSVILEWCNCTLDGQVCEGGFGCSKLKEIK